MKNRTFIIIMSILVGPSIFILIFGRFIFPQKNSSSNNSWNEGFNYEWVGTYVSKADADYVVAFKLGIDGTYAFVYGSNPSISTTYSGKYNNNFRNGVSKSGLNYRITEIKVTGFDKTSINLSVDWRLPSGNDTGRYVLYRK